MKNASQSLWRISEALTPQVADKTYFFTLRLVSMLVVLPALLFFVLLAYIAGHYLWWLLRNFPLFQDSSGLFATLFYVLVALLWGFIVAVLLRPLSTIKERQKDTLLTKKTESTVYGFIENIAKSLGLESQYEIAVNMDISVDARYLTLADFRSQKLSVSLGLPLIQTLSLEQIAALITRELSRFVHPSEGASYSIIRGVIAWFHRVINNDDGWQAKITALSEHDNLRWLSLALTPLSLGISAVEALFRALLSFAEGVSRSSLAQLELRADSTMAQLLGEKDFTDLLKRLVHIDQAFHSALEHVLSESVVPQNINKLIASQAENTEMDLDQFVEMTLAERLNSAYFLPSPQSRLTQVEELRLQKKSRMQGPAAVLIKSLDLLGSALSEEIYAQYELSDSRSTKATSQTHPLPRFDLAAEEEILRRFSSGLFRRDIVWQPPQDEKLSQLPPAKIKPFLNKVVASIRQNLPSFSEYVGTLDEFNKVNATFHFYKWLVKDGSKNRPSADKIDAAKRAVIDFDRHYKETKDNLIKSYGMRVAAAVAFGQDQKAYPSAKKLLVMLTRLSHLENLVIDSKVKVRTIEQLLARIRKGDDLHQATVSRLTKMVMKAISSMETVMQSFPQALLGAEGAGDLAKGKLRLEELNGANYETTVLHRFAELLIYYEGYNTAVSAKLARFVEMIESKHGVDAVVKVNLQDRKLGGA